MNNVYDEDRLSNYTLYFYENDSDRSVYLQGDDARAFEHNVLDPLTKIWLRRYGKGLRHKAYGPFKNYEAHLHYCISQYFY